MRSLSDTPDVVRVLRAYGHLAILVAVALIEIAYAYPGYMNYDAADQLLQSRAHWITDYHPPFIVVYMRFFEVFVEGPLLLLVTQLAMFLWGVYALLRVRFAKYPSACIAAAVLLFPPVFTTLAVVWKDSQMAAFLVAGAALAIRPRRVARVAGLLLLAAAAAVRWNGGAALPPLFLVAVVMAWPSLRRRWARLAVVFALLGVTFVASSVLTRALTDKREYNWYRTTAVFDIVGMACHSSITADEEFVKLLDGTGLKETHDLKARFCYLFPPGKRSWYEYSVLFTWPPTATERLARKHVWKEMLTSHPAAWLEGRIDLARDHLGLHADLAPWEPICQDFTGTELQREQLHVTSTHSSFQRWMGNTLRWFVDHGPLYRPWIYVVASLLLVGWAIWRRDLFVGCLVASGLAYQVSIFLLANAPDFRFSHWMITCVLVGLALRYAKPPISDSVPTALAASGTTRAVQ